MSDLARNLAQNLARLRKEKGLSQEGLAEASGLATNSIKNWERQIRFPSLDNLEKIAKALGSTSLELLAPEKPEPAPTVRGLLGTIEAQQDEIDRMEAMLAGIPRDIAEALVKADGVDIEMVRVSLGLDPADELDQSLKDA